MRVGGSWRQPSAKATGASLLQTQNRPKKNSPTTTHQKQMMQVMLNTLGCGIAQDPTKPFGQLAAAGFKGCQPATNPESKQSHEDWSFARR